MNLYNDLSFKESLADAEASMQKEKQYLLKKISAFAKSVYFDSDVYSTYPSYVWIDELSDNKGFKVKFNMDDAIHNEFYIKNNTVFSLDGLKTLEEVLSSEDETLKFKLNLNKIIKKNLDAFELKYKLAKIYLEKNKIIFYLNQ